MIRIRSIFLTNGKVLMVGLAIFSLLLCSVCGAAAKKPERKTRLKDYNLAPTPPMGWNSWNRFGCDVSAKLICEMADALVTSGMKQAGYEYVVIDDCWQVDRDAQGNIIADPNRFPGGIQAVADYVHSLGLKFGLYSCAGRLTCQRRPGSRGHEFQDARQYAAWGVDYLKYDWCNHGHQNARASYETMAEALMVTGRPIVFSICEWGTNEPWRWGRTVGHLWRTTGDITDCFSCNEGDSEFHNLGWTLILDKQVGLEKYARPGAWNDPDMLEVGNGGMTIAEYRAHFSMWCMLAAPLMAGNDLRSMEPDIQSILTNEEAIVVNQDPLGKQGKKVRDDGDQEVWIKPLTKGQYAVALLNRGEQRATMGIAWEELGLSDQDRYQVRDLWARKDLGTFRGSFSAKVSTHDVVMVRVFR